MNANTKALHDLSQSGCPLAAAAVWQHQHQNPVAPDTIDTNPEKTVLGFADPGKVGVALPADGGSVDAVLEEFRRGSVDDEALAGRS